MLFEHLLVFEHKDSELFDPQRQAYYRYQRSNLSLDEQNSVFEVWFVILNLFGEKIDQFSLTLHCQH